MEGLFLPLDFCWAACAAYWSCACFKSTAATMRRTRNEERNCRVQVRLDNKEYQGFMKAVRKSGLSQEVYLRHLINGVVPQDAPPPDYYHFMRELHGVGNNLNQIAQKAHVLGVIDERRYDEEVKSLTVSSATSPKP